MNNNSGIYQEVNDHYGTLARGAESTGSGAIAKAFGYTQEELNSIPTEANLGVSCGNPLAIASLHEVSLSCFSAFTLWILLMRNRRERRLSISAAAQASTSFSRRKRLELRAAPLALI
jgi:hypothetical protein